MSARTVSRHVLLFFAFIALLAMPAYTVTAPAITLTDGSRTVTIDGSGTVSFGGTCDPTTCKTMFATSSPGQVVWGGTLGVFTINAVVGVTKPALGAPAVMDLSLQSIQTGATGGSLWIEWSDTNFSQQNITSMTLAAGGLISGTASVTLNGFASNANTLFSKSIAIGSLGAFTSPTITGSLDSTNVPTVSPFSLTEQAVLVMGANSSVGLDFELDLEQGTPPEISCRMTGGGVDTNYNWDHTLVDGKMITNGAGHLPPGIDRYQYGGQVGAPTAADPQPYGEWQHSQQTGPSGSFSFHTGTASAAPGTRIVDVRCSDPGFCNPARPAPAKQLDFDAIGTFSNLGSGKNAPHFQIDNANVIPEPNGGKNKLFTFHWVEVNVDDMGEPGNKNNGAPDPNVCPGRGFGEKSAGPFVPDPVNDPSTIVNLPTTLLGDCSCPDFYRITIYNGVTSDKVTYLPDGKIDPNSLDRTNIIYEVFGYVDGGNFQIHPPTGSN